MICQTGVLFLGHMAFMRFSDGGGGGGGGLLFRIKYRRPRYQVYRFEI